MTNLARGNPAGHLIGGLSSAAEHPEQVGVVVSADIWKAPGLRPTPAPSRRCAAVMRHRHGWVATRRTPSVHATGALPCPARRLAAPLRSDMVLGSSRPSTGWLLALNDDRRDLLRFITSPLSSFRPNRDHRGTRKRAQVAQRPTGRESPLLPRLLGRIAPCDEGGGRAHLELEERPAFVDGVVELAEQLGADRAAELDPAGQGARDDLGRGRHGDPGGDARQFVAQRAG